MADGSHIDPHYAAQFQRGFDPAQDAAPPTDRQPVRLEGGPPPTAPRVPDPPPLVERPLAKTPAVTGAAVDEELAPQGRPRLEWALLGGGGVLLALSAMLFAGAVEARDSGLGTGLEDQLYGTLVSQLPGPLLVAGVLGVVLWIVLRAVFPGRRSG